MYREEIRTEASRREEGQEKIRVTRKTRVMPRVMRKAGVAGIIIHAATLVEAELEEVEAAKRRGIISQSSTVCPRSL